MKKISTLAVVGATFLLVPGVQAISQNANAPTQAQPNGTGNGYQASPVMSAAPRNTQPLMSPAPMGNNVENRNSLQVKNQGEDTQLKIETQEMEMLDADSMATGTPQRSGGTASSTQQRMSQVSQQVQQLLETKTFSQGIGDQVRLIAQDQQRDQDQLQLQYDKVMSRSNVTRRLIGPDYKAIHQVEQQLDQIQNRTQQLAELKVSLTDQAEIAQVDELIRSLQVQQTALQQELNQESATQSVFGWLFKLFN